MPIHRRPQIANGLRVGKVFVAGGLPTVTYNPRASLELEQTFQDYLDERHRILSISGPTKTGKTVLVRNMLSTQDALWLSGGAISSIDGFWETILDELSVYTTIEHATDTEERNSRTASGEIGITIAKGSRGGSSEISSAQSDRLSRTRPAASTARKSLISAMRAVVIDDFHYIAQPVQLEIVRGLKDLIFEGLPVVVIAVPHRAYDVVRVEREMTGRVQQLEVSFWTNQELMEIATKGFEALNVGDSGANLSSRLVEESFASPHLMQDFCLNICKDNGIREAQTKTFKLKAPNWSSFFIERSSSASKSAFELLARGPRQRTDRKARALRNGSITDIYGAVLEAIAKTGPLTSITYENLRTALKDIMLDEAPQRHEVTRVLEEMSKIAREQIEGEPVVDYDDELGTLYISDPYFAYFLRWGRRSTAP
ncbi:ATP-binding protein [Actinospica durhamensis]|uniref:ATP-binding protein n=1 Tax=Actinospica durhamensis TaxID=1508375 RepID=A0A941EYH7_9ACTN|nr:ATP-binding protein [Actinospica durhamensis]MBR7839451.1 ATP-binding protein [Actinospica durhamensis]